MFELWVSIALLGVWSCIGVIYNNSRKTSKQMDEVVKSARLRQAVAPLLASGGNLRGTLAVSRSVAANV